MSAEGCAQGDPLGPFVFAIGYHWTLLEMQVRNPSALILARRSFMEATHASRLVRVGRVSQSGVAWQKKHILSSIANALPSFDGSPPTNCKTN